MIKISEILSTIKMIQQENLDIRTITMGISLLDCSSESVEETSRRIYEKITSKAEKLVETGEVISKEFGIPIINKRISVTPISLLSPATKPEDFVEYAKALEKAALKTGVNFIGGYSALVQKGFTEKDKIFLESIPYALKETTRVCSSVNVGSTKAGINMDAVYQVGKLIKKTAELTKDNGAIGCAKFVAFCNAVEDNPFMAGAFHGVSEPECVINVGVSGPGVVKHELEKH